MAKEYSLLFSSGLNSRPFNISFMQYSWSQRYKYSNTAFYPEYPELWSAVSEPLLDNTIYAPFSLMANYTRYAPASGTIYNSTIDNSEVQSVTSKYLTSCNQISTNKVEQQINMSVSFDTSLCGSQLIDTSNGNLISNGSTIILDAYGVKYLTKPFYAVQPDGTTQINNYLSELIILISTPSSLQGASSCVSMVYQFAQYPVLIGLIGVVFFIGLVITVIFGWSVMKSGLNISTGMVVSAILTIVAIGVLVIVGIVMISTLCAAGIY
jgi:hypothetical protein